MDSKAKDEGMIERPGMSPPSQEPPESSDKSAKPVAIRLFGYEIKLGYIGKKLIVFGIAVKRLGRKLLVNRRIKSFHAQPKLKPEVRQAKRKELQLKNEAQAIKSMHSLAKAIQTENVTKAVYSLYNLRQTLALKTTLQGKESFDVTDLMAHAESALDSVVLDARELGRLNKKKPFLAELMALLRIMDTKAHQGELISSLISKSASGCLIRPNPLLIVQEKLFPNFDLLSESEKYTAANIDPRKINLCFAALKKCRTRLEKEADNLVSCMQGGAVESLPEKIDHFMKASAKTIREQEEEISFERVKAYMKKNIWSMVIPDGVNLHLRAACQRQESKLLQYMAAVQELASRPSGSRLADFRVGVAKELNDLICRQLELGDEDEPEELAASQRELWQLKEEKELSEEKASRKVFLEKRIQQLIDEKESRGRSLVHLERMGIKASPEMVAVLKERFERPLKFDLLNEGESGF